MDNRGVKFVTVKIDTWGVNFDRFKIDTEWVKFDSFKIKVFKLSQSKLTQDELNLTM